MNSATTGTYVLYANLRHTIFREMASGLRAWHHETGTYTLRIVELEDHAELREALDGALGIAGTFYDETAVSIARESGVPAVSMANSTSGTAFATVHTDDVQVGRMAGDFFIRRGFRAFAYMRSGDKPYSRDRELGFRSILKEKLPNFGDPAIFDLDEQEEAVRYAMESLIPVAIFCANDGIARSLLELMLQSKVSVPSKAALLGVDNDRLEQNLSPIPLASIRLPGHQIGFMAGQLLDKINREAARRSKPVVERILVPPVEVVLRRSADALAVADVRTKRLLHLIHTYPGRFKSVQEIVDAAKLPRRTAEDVFRQHTGRTLFEELSNARFDRIVSLLLESDNTLSQIAEQVGFSDAHALCIAFKRRFKTTPGTYRKQARSLRS